MEFNYILIFELIVGIYAAVKARQKNRNPLLWFALGAVFSVIALAVVMMLPQKDQNTTDKRTLRDSEDIHEYPEATEVTQDSNVRPFIKPINKPANAFSETEKIAK